GAFRLARRADAVGAPLAERVLDDAVFSGVVADHDESSARVEAVTECGEGRGKSGQLIIYGDAHRLKYAREITRTGTWPEHRSNRADEIIAGVEDSVRATFCDLTRHATRLRLITILLENAGDFLLIG